MQESSQILYHRGRRGVNSGTQGVSTQKKEARQRLGEKRFLIFKNKGADDIHKEKERNNKEKSNTGILLTFCLCRQHLEGKGFKIFKNEGASNIHKEQEGDSKEKFHIQRKHKEILLTFRLCLYL